MKTNKLLKIFLAITLIALGIVFMMLATSCSKSDDEAVLPDGGYVDILSKNKSAIYSITVKNIDSTIVKSFNHDQYLKEVDSVKDEDFPYVLSIYLPNGWYAMHIICKKSNSFGFKQVNVTFTMTGGHYAQPLKLYIYY